MCSPSTGIKPRFICVSAMKAWDPEHNDNNTMCQALLLCPFYRWGKLSIKGLTWLSPCFRYSSSHFFYCPSLLPSSLPTIPFFWLPQGEDWSMIPEIPLCSPTDLSEIWPTWATISKNKEHSSFPAPRGVEKVGLKCPARNIFHLSANRCYQ